MQRRAVGQSQGPRESSVRGVQRVLAKRLPNCGLSVGEVAVWHSIISGCKLIPEEQPIFQAWWNSPNRWALMVSVLVAVRFARLDVLNFKSWSLVRPRLSPRGALNSSPSILMYVLFDLAQAASCRPLTYERPRRAERFCLLLIEHLLILAFNLLNFLIY